MKQYISSFYRKIVPEKTRKVIYKAFLGNLLMLIRGFPGTMRWCIGINCIIPSSLLKMK